MRRFILVALYAVLHPMCSIAGPVQALGDFKDRCIELVATGNPDVFNGLAKVEPETTAEFIKTFQAPEDTILWTSNANEFAIQTYANTFDYCSVLGFSIDFLTLKPAVDAWINQVRSTFRTKGNFTLNSKSGRAGIFLAGDYGDRGVLQVTLQYSEKNGKLASFYVIRLDDFSPAARELFPEERTK